MQADAVRADVIAIDDAGHNTVDNAVGFVSIAHNGAPLRIEYTRIGTERAGAPLIVFLHEGLGSVAQWRGFPRRLCDALQARGLVYSRPGYGRSTPRAAGERWGRDYLHRQAHEVLPALLAALGIDARAAPPWLFGHSDGGSIALLYAARFPEAVAGAVVMAPHYMVEAVGLAGIARARSAWLSGDLRERLARVHDDPASAFWGWCDAWLDPAFADWSIEAELPAIRCPLLALQGVDDDYGTLEQIRGIGRRVAHARVLELPACGHAPQRDQPQAVIDATRALMQTCAASPRAQTPIEDRVR